MVRPRSAGVCQSLCCQEYQTPSILQHRLLVERPLLPCTTTLMRSFPTRCCSVLQIAPRPSGAVRALHPAPAPTSSLETHAQEAALLAMPASEASATCSADGTWAVTHTCIKRKCYKRLTALLWHMLSLRCDIQATAPVHLWLLFCIFGPGERIWTRLHSSRHQSVPTAGYCLP